MTIQNQAVLRKIFMKRLDIDPNPEYKHSRRGPERLRGNVPTGDSARWL